MTAPICTVSRNAYSLKYFVSYRHPGERDDFYITADTIKRAILCALGLRDADGMIVRANLVAQVDGGKFKKGQTVRMTWDESAQKFAAFVRPDDKFFLTTAEVLSAF